MNLVFSIFAADIVPVFAIALAGFLLARFGGADARTLVRVVFYVLLPCLAFRMVLDSAHTGPNVTNMVWLAAAIMACMGAIGYLAARAAGLRGDELRAFLMVVMFSNGGNYGLPVVRFAYPPQAFTYATIFFLSGSVYTYLGAALIAGGGRGRLADSLRGALDKVWRMPSLYGVTLAAIVLAAGWQVPAGVMRPVELMAESALPMMILVLGMQLERTTRPARPRLVALAVGISLLIAPLVALSLATLAGLNTPARQAMVTLSSMPVAVVTTILALEFDLPSDFVTGAVFASTLLSPLTLTPLIAYLQQGF